MSTLVLELRQGDMMVVNGAPLRFRNRARIELAARARFLFGKQIMPPEAADTPARRSISRARAEVVAPWNSSISRRAAVRPPARSSSVPTYAVCKAK